MSFLERERTRLIEERDHLFKDPGRGLFSGKPREFVLNEAAANLWEGIRPDAIEYFARNSISSPCGASFMRPVRSVPASSQKCLPVIHMNRPVTSYTFPW